MSRRIAGVTVGVLVVGVLAGCTGGEEPVGSSTVTASPSPEVELTPTPTPTPTSILGRVLDLSDPELGIVFDDVPDLAGDEADIYNWIATYELEYWRTLVTNVASPAFDAFTSSDLEAWMAELAAINTADQSVWGGVFHVRVAEIVVDGDTATGTICDDYRQVTLEEPGGPVSVEERGDEVPMSSRLNLARSPIGEGLWIVQSGEVVGPC